MPARKTPSTDSTPVEELWNLSDLTGSWLRELGISNYSELCAADLLSVFLELKARHRQVTKLMYYALWGAVANAHWNQIPDSEKDRVTSALAQ
jgi:hypothetical protein